MKIYNKIITINFDLKKTQIVKMKLSKNKMRIALKKVLINFKFRNYFPIQLFFL